MQDTNLLYQLNSEIIEIKLGCNDYTSKEIRIAHNIEKLLLCNVFGPATIE